MAGIIRTYQRCPVCHKAFIHIPKAGFFCAQDKTFPNRFLIDLYLNGQRIRIYSDKSGEILENYSQAYRLQAKITWEIENHTFDPSKYVRQDLQKFQVDSLLDRFEKAKLAGIAPSYRKDYRLMIFRARKHFGPRDVRDLRKLDLINYKESIQEGHSPKTVKNHLVLFQTFLRWCWRDLEILENVPAMPEVDVPAPSFRWLPQLEISSLYENVPLADRPIVGFLLLHGCRPSEARALKVGDVNLQMARITISCTFSGNVYRPRRKGRGAKEYTIPVHHEMLDIIRERCAEALPTAWLFPNPRTGREYSKCALNRVWNVVRKAAGVGKSLRLYDASRHSVASNLRASGADLSDIKDQLGHADIRTTLKYAHADQEKLRTNLERLSLNKVVDFEKDCRPALEEKDSAKN